MTTKQKNYIEEHIDLIENNNWNEFFRNSPDGTGNVLYRSGIDFMSEMKTVPQHCFKNSEIDSITIPEGVTTIGVGAFYGCTGLTSITIPDSVTHIGVLTFYGCSNLKSITIPASVKNIVEGAFCNLGKNVHIQFNGTKDEWKNIYQTSSFEKTYFTVTCLDGKIVKKAS